MSLLLAEPLQSHQALKHAFDHRHIVPDIRSHMVQAVVSVHMATGDGRGGDIKVKGRKISYALRTRKTAKHNYASHEPKSFSCTRPAARPLYVCQRPSDGATSARCEACSACRRHATRRLEDAEDHRYAERKLEANRGAARVDSARTHVAVRR